MKKNIISGFEAGKRVKELLLAHPTEVAAVAELQDSKVMLEETLSEMETAAAIQQNDSKGETINKEDLQVTMAKTILRFSRRCRVKAKNAGDKDLAKALSHKISYYDYNNTDAVSLARCTATKDKIKNNTAILSNITPAEITEMETAISKFEAAMALPKAAISNKKVYGTDKLEELNATLDETLDDIEDLIHSYY